MARDETLHERIGAQHRHSKNKTALNHPSPSRHLPSAQSKTSNPGPTLSTDLDDREARLRRIQDIKNQYLKTGDLPPLLCTELRGPFDKGWANPWESPPQRPVLEEPQDSVPDIEVLQVNSENAANSVVGRRFIPSEAVNMARAYDQSLLASHDGRAYAVDINTEDLDFLAASSQQEISSGKGNVTRPPIDLRSVLNHVDQGIRAATILSQEGLRVAYQGAHDVRRKRKAADMLEDGLAEARHLSEAAIMKAVRNNFLLSDSGDVHLARGMDGMAQHINDAGLPPRRGGKNSAGMGSGGFHTSPNFAYAPGRSTMEVSPPLSAQSSAPSDSFSPSIANTRWFFEPNREDIEYLDQVTNSAITDDRDTEGKTVKEHILEIHQRNHGAVLTIEEYERKQMERRRRQKGLEGERKRAGMVVAGEPGSETEQTQLLERSIEQALQEEIHAHDGDAGQAMELSDDGRISWSPGEYLRAPEPHHLDHPRNGAIHHSATELPTQPRNNPQSKKRVPTSQGLDSTHSPSPPHKHQRGSLSLTDSFTTILNGDPPYVFQSTDPPPRNDPTITPTQSTSHPLFSPSPPTTAPPPATAGWNAINAYPPAPSNLVATSWAPPSSTTHRKSPMNGVMVGKAHAPFEYAGQGTQEVEVEQVVGEAIQYLNPYEGNQGSGWWA
ncbi:hypothetical protein P152DRAFT_510543 [Eremomyces bilateralis CBS 781.70]|uniref:Uncharacterized protein n=1 Tax=Eremomyces bilateralis CBS 781.70 TaxID=1392243 RepID=A0A6G1GGT1_9PEZI|nr:uncharacterized protein P152DRAFT_510543 [Eremomyces bilateralis CBS 781.70]KAF1817278.1 hypothetical protein P152DRAFT_510543 [Eremomyces bilateralis CBS 781.70]